MGLFSRKSKSSSSNFTPSESSRPSQPPPPFNYSQYPDGLIPNPGGYLVQSPSPVSSYSATQYDQRLYAQTSSSPPPQQSYPGPSQYSGFSNNNFNQDPRQQFAPHQVTNPPPNNSIQYHQDPRHSATQSLPHHQQQQQQQLVTVNVVTNPETAAYRRQPQTQGQGQYPQQPSQRQGIPRCGANHSCERHTVTKPDSPNLGRLFWRCKPCNRFVVWDDER